MTGISNLKRFDTYLSSHGWQVLQQSEIEKNEPFIGIFIDIFVQITSSCMQQLTKQYENALKCRQFNYNNFSVIFGGNFLYDTTQISNRKKNLSNSALIISFFLKHSLAVFVKFKTSTIYPQSQKNWSCFNTTGLKKDVGTMLG